MNDEIQNFVESVQKNLPSSY